MILLIHKVLNYLFKGEVNIMLKSIKKGASVILASGVLFSGLGVCNVSGAEDDGKTQQLDAQLAAWKSNSWTRRIEDMAIVAVFNSIFGIIAKPITEYIQSFSFLSPDSYTISNYIENMNESCEKELKKVRAGKMSEQDAKYRNAIGRDSEILEISNIVSRGGMKSNPVLTGSAGVGKTATIEGLVWRIVSANMDIKDFKNNIGKAKDLTKEQKNQLIEKFELETVKKYGITKSLLNKKVINVNAVSLIVGNSYATSGGMEGAIRRFRALFDKYKGRNDTILFIDEIHRLPRSVEEILYPAMEDFVIDIVTGKGQMATSYHLPLPKFTLIGATTRAGQLSAPLRDRFGVVLRLELYTPEQLAQIVRRSATILGIKTDKEGALEIASRSRGTPRIANRLLKRVRDFAQIINNGEINYEIAKDALDKLEIDELGLDANDRRLLKTMIEFYGGGPVGLETIAAAIGEEAITIEDVYEPFLMQIGFLSRTPRGRCVTKSAYLHMGYKAENFNRNEQCSFLED